jgi:MATE family multidrug resistance protein
MRQELRPTLRLAVPLIVAEVGWMAMQIVDTMMVGRLPESAVAIGAVSLGSVLFFAVGIFGGGLLLGMDTLVSQSFGAGEMEDCHHSLVNSLYMAFVLTPLLMGVVWLWVPFLRAFRIQPEVLETAIPYLRALNWSMLPLLLYFSFRRYLQGIHIVKPVAWALITANLVNVVANWALVYGHLGVPAMRTEGAGWATCISRSYLTVFLVVTILYTNRRGQLGLARTPLRPDFERIRELVRLGLPAATQLALEVAVFAAVTALIGRLDAVSLAAHQVTLNTISLTYMVPLGIASAAAVRVGNALGRRDPAGAARAGWAAIGLGAGFMAAAAVVLWTAPGPIVRIYTPDHQVLVTGTLLLFIAAFFQLFDGIQTVATGALRGAGDTRTPMITHILSYWLMGLPLGAWLCFRRGWGAAGLWLGLCLALIVIGLVLLLAWRRQVRAFGRLVAPERGANPAEA